MPQIFSFQASHSLTPYHQQAFSLIELMITLIIMGVIISIAYPYVLSTRQAMESKRIENILKQALRQARTQTYISKTNRILCTTDTTNQCNRLGQHGLMVFTDHNQNNIIDNHETILHQTTLNLRYGSIVVNASAHRNHIRYQGNTGKPTGWAYPILLTFNQQTT